MPKNHTYTYKASINLLHQVKLWGVKMYILDSAQVWLRSQIQTKQPKNQKKQTNKQNKQTHTTHSTHK